MSLFEPETITCPACKAAVAFDAVASVNAERRPDLRAAIIDGSFQVSACPSCGKRLRLDPMLTYLDLPRAQWILVQPIEGLAEWPALEKQARTTFDSAFGAAAPRPARAIGAGLKARITFGWAALCEKLLCADHLLDDVTLEALKCGLLRGLPGQPLGDDTELRLVAATPAMLHLAWINTSTDATLETLEVPREQYDEIAGQEAWQDLRRTLAEGAFVDMHRVLVAAETAG